MKRRISLLLALVIVLGSFGTAFAAVPTTAEGKAEFLSKEGILKGSLKGDLMLNEKENRQNMVVMLSRLMKQETEAKDYKGNEAAKFEDVTNKDYKSYVAWSVANKYIVGKSETNFGSHDKVTAQQYSIVLLRALGYFTAEADNLNLEAKRGFEEAQKLGLLKDLDVEAKTEITREQMSVMIYNALGTKMRDSDQTLAEFLGIKMPVDETLEVKSVRTENLGEVIVELSNAAAVANQKELLNPDNYNVFGSQDRTVKEVKLEGNNVIVVLENNKNEAQLVKGREYKLAIRNVDSAINKDYAFKAEDNAFPVAEKVEVLGEHGIKVVFSEPIKANDLDTKFVFKSDAKNEQLAMNAIYYNGREVTLVPYYRGDKFPLGKATLTVKSVEDLAGLKSTEKTFTDLEVKRNEVKPEVEKVEVKNTRVIVTFKEDVFSRSIDKSNISWKEVKGGKATEATDFNILDGRRVEYLFEGNSEIPADLRGDRVELTIKEVTNFSRVAMDKYVEYHSVDLDYTRPEVKGFYVKATDKDTLIQAELRFTKELDEYDVANVNKNPKLLAEQVKLYGTSENKWGELVADKDAIKDAIASVELKEKDLLVVNFNKEVIKAGKHYILEVEKFRDNTTLRNRMVAYRSEMFREGNTENFVVESVRHTGDVDKRGEIVVTIDFSNPVDKKTARNKANYVFSFRNITDKDMEDMRGHNEIVVRNDGKTVELHLAEDTVNNNEITSLRITDSIKDVDGNRLKKEYIYSFKEEIADNHAKLDKAVTELEKEIAEANEAIKAAEEQLKDQNLTDAEKAAITAAKEAAEGKLTAAEKALKAAEKQLEKPEAITTKNINKVEKATKELKEAREALEGAKDKVKEDLEELKGKIKTYVESLDKIVRENKEDNKELFSEALERLIKAQGINGLDDNKLSVKFEMVTQSQKDDARELTVKYDGEVVVVVTVLVANETIVK